MSIMADMTPQEAAKCVRDGTVPEWFDRRFREALTVLADLADALDPPKPKAEWTIDGNMVFRNGIVVGMSYDNDGNCGLGDTALADHRAAVTMHALRADEEGIDVVALIEEARR